MSVSVTKSSAGTKVVLLRFPFRRLAAGSALVIGLLIPSLFELSEPPAARSRHTRLEQIAALVALATVGMSPMGRYQFDTDQPRLRWWQIGINGLHWGQTKLRNGKPMEERGRIPFARFGWYQVRIPGEPRSIVIPLSFSKVASDRLLNSLRSGLGKSGVADSVEPIVHPRKQISLRRIFGIITVIAVTCGVIRFVEMQTESSLACLLLVGFCGWSFSLTADRRSRVQAVLAAAYVPFVWVIAYNRPFGHTSGMLSSLPLAPGIVPVMFVLRGHFEKNIAFVFAFVAIEIIAIVWLARRSAMAAMWTLVVVLACSSLGSFIFHALYRM